MNKLMKILAFISIFVLLTIFTGTVSATNSTVNLQNSIQTVTNNTHNNVSSCICTDTLNRNISQKNVTGIVMATTDYNCGPAALATILNNMEINVTQDELAVLAGTDESGTTMYGLLQAARSKGLIAKCLKLSANKLRPNNIVFLTINRNNHFSVIKEITNTTVYLADSSLGNINMALKNFTTVYSGNALVVTNDTNNTQLNSSNTMTIDEMKNAKGKDDNWFLKEGMKAIENNKEKAKVIRVGAPLIGPDPL